MGCCTSQVRPKDLSILICLEQHQSAGFLHLDASEFEPVVYRRVFRVWAVFIFSPFYAFGFAGTYGIYNSDFSLNSRLKFLDLSIGINFEIVQRRGLSMTDKVGIKTAVCRSRDL